MKKKVLIILLLLICFTFGCSKNTPLDKETETNRNNLLTSIISEEDNKVVVKHVNNNDEDTYYEFYINKGSYTEYLYTFHKSEESYNTFIENHDDTVYDLVKYEDYLVTRISLNKTNSVIEGNIKDYLVKKYSSKDGYEIIVK